MKNLEAGYEMIWNNFLLGKKPKHMHIRPEHSNFAYEVYKEGDAEDMYLVAAAKFRKGNTSVDVKGPNIMNTHDLTGHLFNVLGKLERAAARSMERRKLAGTNDLTSGNRDGNITDHDSESGSKLNAGGQYEHEVLTSDSSSSSPATRATEKGVASSRNDDSSGSAAENVDKYEFTTGSSGRNVNSDEQCTSTGTPLTVQTSRITKKSKNFTRP